MAPPTRRIKTEADMMEFYRSPGYSKIVSYLEKFCLLVKGHIEPPREALSDDVKGVVGLLSKIEESINRIEPIDQPMRFGNKAFRQFHAWLTDSANDLVNSLEGVPTETKEELVPYLLDSFGNPIRIDFGTGHEAAFFLFLVILIESGALQLSYSVILVVFRKYISVVRLVTNKYMMEPAGSHGVWGLDDYNHLPFLFGAAQLIGHEVSLVKPVEMLDKCDQLAEKCMYAECIQYIKRTKCKFARFNEVAPMLSDLARHDTWSQVCFGLMKLFKSEVLAKRPIVQHFFFGKTIQWTDLS